MWGPVLMAALRGLLPAAGGAAAQGAGASAAGSQGAGATSLFAGLKEQIGLGTVANAQERVSQAESAKKPSIDFGKLISKMNQPGALEAAKARVQKQETKQANELQQAKQAETEENEKLIPKLQKAGNTMLAVFGPAGKIAATGVSFLIGMKLWTDRLEQSRRVLEPYNAAIAASYAQLDIQRVRQNIHKANATSGSTAALNRDIKEFRDAMLPLEELVRNYGNVIAIVLVNIATFLAKGTSIAVTAAKFTPGIVGELARMGDIIERWQNASDADKAMAAQQHLIDGLMQPKNPWNNRPDLQPPKPLGNP